MVALTLTIAATLAAGFISRNRSPNEHRWKLALAASTLAAVGLALLCTVAVLSRGYTNFGAALCGVAYVLAGAHCIVVQRLQVRVAHGPQESNASRRSITVALGHPRVGRPPFEFLVGWTVATLAISLMPLRHMGAAADSSTASRVIAVLTPAASAPLSERRPIDLGQCITSRDAGPSNRVTSCLADHGGQVLEVIDPSDDCLPPSSWNADGLRIRVVKTDPIDGRRYCVASLTGGSNDLRHPIYRDGLALTL